MGDVPSTKELASTLQTMFPHLKVKTGNSPKVGWHSSSSTMQSVSIADEPLARTVSVEEPLARTVSVTSKKSWADEPLICTRLLAGHRNCAGQRLLHRSC